MPHFIKLFLMQHMDLSLYSTTAIHMKEE